MDVILHSSGKDAISAHRRKKHPNMKLCLGFGNCISYFKMSTILIKYIETEHYVDGLRCGINDAS